ncbi:hypothetical protein F4779DRAFT_203433 [Xylariaceae sp. FL0662B]|nr:hypothetical protein F4779DRAFT_203433 [Xylariaceae sp. FL0662B]
MFPPIPVYSGNKGDRQKAVKESMSSASNIGRPPTVSSPNAAVHNVNNRIDDLLEPAIEGPPSPERIRAINNQMRRSSATDKHHSQLTTSSGSSSSDRRPSWDHSLEYLSLSRNPSQRSSSSSMPSWDRPESVQLFGKTIFNRRGKLRTGSSDHTHSSSSLNSIDQSVDIPSIAPKDQHFIHNMFSRRKASRADIDAPSQRKLQISGPYNFQHLTHTQKDSIPDLDRTSRMELVTEFSSMRSRRTTDPSWNGTRPRRTTDASLDSIHSNELYFANFSSESFQVHEDPSAERTVNGDAEAPSPRSTGRMQSQDKALPPPPPPMRSVKRNLSQDMIRVPPPRPPRSPSEGTFSPPIPPPPRTSSRVSMRYDGFDPLSTTSLERPATSCGFRQPQPFIPPSVDATNGKVNQSIVASLQQFPHAVSTSDDAAWPLVNPSNPLPDVPEEEEHHILVRQSQMSVTSNHSSLRGSVSVPLLRQMSSAKAPQRPPSNASDTLGIFGSFTGQRAFRTGAHDSYRAEDIFCESWEDDIDYCYEHAAEADCDYAWERASSDIQRESDMEETETIGDQTETIITIRSVSPEMLSPKSTEVPALSPASQTSQVTQQEVVTPTNLAVPVASNFSLPRRDSSAQLQREISQSNSSVSSFKESEGFTLSPSLLIPNDYHQQMLQYEREDLREREPEEDFLIQGPTLNDESIPAFGKPIAASKVRSSGSTTSSTLSERSKTSSRHISSTSTSTAFTRWTGSSTSSWQGCDSLQIPKSPVAKEHNIPSPKLCAMFPEPGKGTLKKDPGREKHSRAQSHADLLMRTGRDTAPPLDVKPAKEPSKTRRRARTISRSHNTPQFLLFPQLSAHGNPF